MPDLFTDAVTRIEAAYSRLGHRHGWRFLATPRSTLNADATLAVVRLNPGGELVDPSHGVESCESGSGYVHEEWKPSSPGNSPLQLQVRSMFDWLGRDPDKTLSAYFVPFRSKRLKDLAAKRESFEFAVQLWGGIFAELPAPVVVCIGADVERGLLSVMGKPTSITRLSVAWGNQTARLNRYANRVLLRLPHLSVFRIFAHSRPKEPLHVIRSELERHCAELRVSL